MQRYIATTFLAVSLFAFAPEGTASTSNRVTTDAKRPQQSVASSTPASSTSSSSAKKTTNKKSSKKHHAKREPLQKAPTPDRISEIQSALARGGYYQGAPNGKWDSNTVDAMQKFQSANGLSPSGKIDALSLQKMGLGSDIAGVSAPKPVAPTSANASTTSATPAQTAAASTSPAPASDSDPKSH